MAIYETDQKLVSPLLTHMSFLYIDREVGPFLYECILLAA